MNLNAARDILNSNWDEGETVSVHLPADLGRFFLMARGWTQEDDARWASPDGGRYWELSECLALAICAEVLC